MSTNGTNVQIGTVELLRERVYPLPGGKADDPETVLVEPGEYPVYTEGGLCYWLMEGRLNRVEVECEMVSGRPGDSLNVMRAKDTPSDKPITTCSNWLSVEAFRRLLDLEPSLPEEQRRYVFTLTRKV